MLWALLYVANVPLFLASLLDFVFRVIPTGSWISHLVALVSAAGCALTAREQAMQAHDVMQVRDEGVSMAKGVAVLLVAVIHSSDPAVLSGWFVHRRLVDMAVPTMLVSYGITCRASVSRCGSNVLWLRRRAQRMVPLLLVAMAAIWTLRLGTFCKLYAFLGGKLPVALCVVGNALFMPGCVGGLWFVTAFSQILAITHVLVRHSKVVAPALVAMQVMAKSSPVLTHPSLPYLVPPCEGDGLLYAASNVFTTAGYVALGVVHGARFAMSFEKHSFFIAGCACVMIAFVTQIASACKPLFVMFECVSALVLASALIGTLRRVQTRTTLARFLRHCGDESFSIFVGHVVALNFLVREFTVASYRLPFDGVSQSALFIVLSVGAGLLAARLARILSTFSACRVSGCALLVLSADAIVLQYQQNALASDALSAVSDAHVFRAEPITPKAPYAFFTLVKGGAEEDGYAEYKTRTRTLHALVQGADDIAFHEGNIPAALQTKLEQELRVTFFDAREWGGFDKRVEARRIPFRLNGEYPMGYKHMCRFFALQWMYALRRYEWVMRIDEDVVVTHISPDIFREIAATNAVYFYAADVEELHDETVQTFQPWVDDYARLHDWSETVDVKRMFFTNVFASKPVWWLGERVSRFLDDVDATGNIFLHRWGDAPIQTVTLKAFASKDEYQFITIDYHHGSTHDLVRRGRSHRVHQRTPPVDSTLRDFKNDVLPCLVADVYASRNDGQPHSDKEHAIDSLRARLMLHTGLGKPVVDPLSLDELIEGVRTAMEDRAFSDYFSAKDAAKKSSIALLLHTTPPELKASIEQHPCKRNAERVWEKNKETIRNFILEKRERDLRRSTRVYTSAEF